MSLTLPLTANTYDSGSMSDSGAESMPKFAHTRAQLSAIARQHKPLETYDNSADPEEFNRVSSSFVNRVVALLVDEQEEELKGLLQSTYGMDDETVEQNMLELMHKHRDDLAGVPFFYLTSTRRPMSRPSSRNSSRLHATRPDTPPTSPLGLGFRRPHTPLTSPLAAPAQPSSYAKSDYSPQSSPILAHMQATQAHAQFTASLPASPLSSPRLLNAKASEFKPIQRPLSAASSTPGSYLRTDTPSPDLWAHNSPRATSNLAIAAPLIADQSPSSHPRSLTPSSSLRTSLRPDEDDDDEHDPFDPFAPSPSALPSFHSVTVSDYDNMQWPYHNMPPYNFTDSPPNELLLQDGTQDMDPEAQSLLTDGMTPFDVLSSVFGSTLAPSELEEALAANGYDFERAMAWLVDRAPPIQPTPQIRTQHMGGRVTLISREALGNGRGAVPPRNNFANGAARYGNNNGNNGVGRARPVSGGNRVCRYFMAGECLRADCRFSHDLERALCRFWLRGTCAKQENCEFLHHLPKDADISSLNIAMARANIQPGTGPLGPHMPPLHNSPPPDEFPVLGYETGPGGSRGRRGGYDRSYNDPSRTRFAAAVKKPVPAPPTTNGSDPTMAARMGGPSADLLQHHQGRSAIVAPRPSPRIKLRAPLLLPTLPTGESVSSMYMAYRSRALQLGAARNACLSRAADAWRRGDGAAAKRFSREGHDLNAKMAGEMADAAGKLVAERAKVAEQAVRNREASWSDDPGDRGSRGNAVGAGYGVCLGIASKDTGDGKLSSEERMEAMLDLHGLHSNEATEVLEQFLLALENEHFYGLAFAIVGEEKHTGTQDTARGASRARLATGVREWLHRWGYPWNERDGIICIDPLTHASE
ncbi:hypothetical protein H0H87_002038 [Tephrocybe sp. NHM501043]|nr:hypothetical protein H0H87_002038 [Tephrocybe sp. NHM501043]